jgi:hypothetical protein
MVMVLLDSKAMQFKVVKVGSTGEMVKVGNCKDDPNVLFSCLSYRSLRPTLILT